MRCQTSARTYRNSFRNVSFTSTSLCPRSASVMSNLCCLRREKTPGTFFFFVFNCSHHAAAGDAHGAVGVKLFGGDERLLMKRSAS